MVGKAKSLLYIDNMKKLIISVAALAILLTSCDNVYDGKNGFEVKTIYKRESGLVSYVVSNGTSNIYITDSIGKFEVGNIVSFQLQTRK